MPNPKIIAEKATLTNFLNCYIRETGRGEILEFSSWFPGSRLLVIKLNAQRMKLMIPLQYWSPTGRHVYESAVYVYDSNQEPQPISCWTAISWLIDNLRAPGDERSGSDELLYRILLSERTMEMYIRNRMEDGDSLYRADLNFLEAEQSLIFGHTFHPSPKSRQGFPEWRQQDYAPETKGTFKIHYFAAHQSIVYEQSMWPMKASEILLKELLCGLDPDESGQFQQEWGRFKNQFVLMAVHPVQGEWLQTQPHVQKWVECGKLIDLGLLGRHMNPTSSVRTVYHSGSEYMYKFSIRVKITNSMRVNKRKELDSALEAASLMSSIGPIINTRYPNYHVIIDGAYMTLGDTAEQESGFELLIRENPFREGEQSEVGRMTVAALTQESIDHSPMLIRNVMERAMNGSVDGNHGNHGNLSHVSVRWFRKYLEISLQPMIWMYSEFGIALEAHLQNCVLVLDEVGYPKALYYRDSQGYYYAKSRVGELEQYIAGISASSNVFEDALVEERFGYYLIVNHLFGLIQSFGIARLVDERALLMEVRAELESLKTECHKAAGLIEYWLSTPVLRCKANLLTRLYDVDELESELEQAVYISFPNPLGTEVPHTELVRKARLVTARWREERESAQC